MKMKYRVKSDVMLNTFEQNQSVCMGECCFAVKILLDDKCGFALAWNALLFVHTFHSLYKIIVYKCKNYYQSP